MSDRSWRVVAGVAAALPASFVFLYTALMEVWPMSPGQSVTYLSGPDNSENLGDEGLEPPTFTV